MQQHPCPKCGHCPTCGRSNHYPVYPVYPWGINPYWRTWHGVVPPNYSGAPQTTSAPTINTTHTAQYTNAMSYS